MSAVMEQMVTGREKERYQKEGYIIIPHAIFPGEVIAAALQGAKRVLKGEYNTGYAPLCNWWPTDKKHVQKIDQAHLSDTGLLDLASQSALGEWAAELTGAKTVQVWASQLFVKPPGGEKLGNVGWHIDRDYWDFWEGDVFTVCVALTETTRENGCLQLIKNTNQWGQSDQNRCFRDGTRQDVDQQLLEMGAAEFVAKPSAYAELPAGGISFHSKNTLHSSGENNDTAPRISLSLHLRTEECRLKPDINHYGTCAYLSDLKLSPIIYHHNHLSKP